MKWKEGWRDKANDEPDQEMHDEYVEKEDLCRADAITYAAIAQAEALERIADMLGLWLNQETMPPDPREPGQTWGEYHQQRTRPLEDF